MSVKKGGKPIFFSVMKGYSKNFFFEVKGEVMQIEHSAVGEA